MYKDVHDRQSDRDIRFAETHVFSPALSRIKLLTLSLICESKQDASSQVPKFALRRMNRALYHTSPSSTNLKQDLLNKVVTEIGDK